MNSPFRAATIAALLMVGVTACREGRTTRTETSCPHDVGLQTYASWNQQVKFPYAAPESKLGRVRQNYDKVGAGSSKEQVIEAFGPPDFEVELYPKEANRPCVGYDFTYYFEKPSDMANEINDKKLQVFFSPNGKVDWIVGNVGLAEKGRSPSRP